MKLVVVSICKDEAKTIGTVLDAIPKKMKGIQEIEKWVIDDGSQDYTAEVAREHGAQVLSDGNNKKLAVRFAEAVDLALERNADFLVNIDGDMQFNPKDIPKILKPLLNNEADFVAADRFTDPHAGKSRRPPLMPRGKYLGNKLGAKIVSKISKHNFTDVTSGFRAYNRAAMFATNINNTHTYTQESFQVMAIKKLRITSVAVPVKYYKSRKSRVVTNVFKYIAISAVNIIRSYRDFAPLRFFGLLGLLPFLIGVACSTFFIAHWLLTGMFSPYKFVGFAGIYFLTLALMLWAMGLVADMLSRMLNNQEKILERLKRIQYDSKHEPK